MKGCFKRGDEVRCLPGLESSFAGTGYEANRVFKIDSITDEKGYTQIKRGENPNDIVWSDSLTHGGVRLFAIEHLDSMKQLVFEINNELNSKLNNKF